MCAASSPPLLAQGLAPMTLHVDPPDASMLRRDPLGEHDMRVMDVNEVDAAMLASVVRPLDLPTVAVVGLGYVGLPIALGLEEIGCTVIGLEISRSRIAAIRRAVGRHPARGPRPPVDRPSRRPPPPDRRLRGDRRGRRGDGVRPDARRRVAGTGPRRPQGGLRHRRRERAGRPGDHPDVHELRRLHARPRWSTRSPSAASRSARTCSSRSRRAASTRAVRATPSAWCRASSAACRRPACAAPPRYRPRRAPCTRSAPRRPPS